MHPVRYRYEILVISRARVVEGGRRIGIVQVAEAFDVRFDRAADGDLSRTQWVPSNRVSKRLTPPSQAYLQKDSIATLRGAA